MRTMMKSHFHFFSHKKYYTIILHWASAKQTWPCANINAPAEKKKKYKPIARAWITNNPQLKPFFSTCLPHWKRTDHQIQGKIPSVEFEVDQVQSSAFLKLMIAAAVCSFISNISYLIVSTMIMEMVVVEHHGTIYLLSG